MSVLKLSFTDNGSIEVDLRKNTALSSIEIMAVGTFGGGTVAIKRKLTGTAISAPCVISWADQTPLELTAPTAGLVIDKYAPEESLEFVLSGATSPEVDIYLIGMGSSTLES